MKQPIPERKVVVLVGGSDLFSGWRGISKGTILIKRAITSCYDDVLAINYNYFLDFGRALAATQKYLQTVEQISRLVLYGYSKGGEIVLKLARSLEQQLSIDLLVTIDIANGPWSDKINRRIPGNVQQSINVFQSTPNILRSHGAAVYTTGKTEVTNIDLTGKIIQGKKVSHSNIEMLMVRQVIGWLTAQDAIYG